MASAKRRGAGFNPANRFERQQVEREPEPPDPDVPDRTLRTELNVDQTRSIIATNASPDIPFDASVNPYRGCEFGCAYCYARTFHEYLGLSAGLDFESKISYKAAAPDLLRAELSSPRWVPKMLALSGVTDCYQPSERALQITRRCLEVLAEFRSPVGVVTKSTLVTRDIDLLQQLARHSAVFVAISITTLDNSLARDLEPRTPAPGRRIETIRSLASAGIPVGVFCAPVIPGLTDEGVSDVLNAAAEAGAGFASYVPLRLPGAVAGLFSDWLDRHQPARKERVLSRIRQQVGGSLNDGRFGHRFRRQGAMAETLDGMFRVMCDRLRLRDRPPELSVASFHAPRGDAFRRQSLLFV